MTSARIVAAKLAIAMPQESVKRDTVNRSHNVTRHEPPAMRRRNGRVASDRPQSSLSEHDKQETNDSKHAET